MITGYSEHAANERTYLAWVRTGIAVIAFGFVIEKFNLFMLTVTGAALGHGLPQGQRELAHLSGEFGRYDGLALVLGGAALVVLATVRFVRTTRLLDDPQAHQAKTGRLELILCGWLVVMVASYSLYLAFA
jgi:putative membrane protein